MKKASNYLFYITLSFLILTIILNTKLEIMDEIWSYTYARNLSLNLLPYKDFNMIVPPLYAFINSIFLRLFGNYLYIFRISYCIYYLILIFILNKLLTTLKINIILKYLTIITLTLLLSILTYSGYNFGQLILLLFIIYLEILFISNPKNNKLNFLLSLVAGLTILTKQSTGLIISLIVIFIPFIYKYYYHKKITIKTFITRIIGIIIPILIFLIYLILNNITTEFIDMVILGIKSFSNSYRTNYLIIFLIITTILFIMSIIKNKTTPIPSIFFLYSISSMLVAYPIADTSHLILGIIPIFIYLISIINKFIKLLSNVSIQILIIILIFSLGLYNTYTYINTYKCQEYPVYKNIPIDKKLENEFITVNNYISTYEKISNIYILDYSAGAYMLGLNKYNKYFDLFMNGNFGINGEKEMLNILNEENNLILINNLKSNWQTPTYIIKYVKDNYQAVDSINGFTVYQKIPNQNA